MTTVIYTNGNQECERLAMLLRSIGGEFLEYKLNNHFTQRSFDQEFGSNAEYPQASIDNKHIGGLKDVLHFLKENHLLNESPELATSL
jgi:glutaredoxin